MDNAPVDKKYAQMGWTASDVQTLAPKMSGQEAEKWLSENQNKIRDRLIEVGWDVMSSMLSYDGIDTGDPEDEVV